LRGVGIRESRVDESITWTVSGSLSLIHTNPREVAELLLAKDGGVAVDVSRAGVVVDAAGIAVSVASVPMPVELRAVLLLLLLAELVFLLGEVVWLLHGETGEG